MVCMCRCCYMKVSVDQEDLTTTTPLLLIARLLIAMLLYYGLVGAGITEQIGYLGVITS